MQAAIRDAVKILDHIYDPSISHLVLIERDQSEQAKDERAHKTNKVATGLRDLGFDEQADAIEVYQTLVDKYVDQQQAVNPADIVPRGSATRDDGRMYLVRTYDLAKRLLVRVAV